jgi:hypothetical protein
MGCFPRSKVSGQHEFEPSRSVNVEIVCVELKSNRGRDAAQHVFSLEETAYSYNAQQTEHWQLTVAHSKSCGGGMLCRTGYKG